MGILKAETRLSSHRQNHLLQPLEHLSDLSEHSEPCHSKHTYNGKERSIARMGQYAVLLLGNAMLQLLIIDE
jgi:hypothetical protein